MYLIFHWVLDECWKNFLSLRKYRRLDTLSCTERWFKHFTISKMRSFKRECCSLQLLAMFWNNCYISGQPLVECGNEFIRFTVKTVKPFRGKVFVKGQYGNSDCGRNYSETHSIPTFHSGGKFLIHNWEVYIFAVVEFAVT